MEGGFGRGSWKVGKPIGTFQLKMKDVCIFKDVMKTCWWMTITKMENEGPLDPFIP